MFWFLAGILSTVATLIVLLPWLRTIPRLGPLPSVPWQAAVAAALMVAAVLGLYRWLGHAEPAVKPAAMITPALLGNVASLSADTANPVTRSGAGSMSSAIASLEARLAKGDGSADDWELLAKSYEFLGRPSDASKARARQLPVVPTAADETAAGTVINGEVSLAAALRTKAAAGATLFIVAKSVDSPGPPVAVFRGSVGSWPVKFTLDDSRSMLPGRNLSSVGRITVEARISQSGQPLPAAGDLQGSTGAFNPADHQPLKILIDRVIT
jgi:hypothetical protein